MITVQIEVPTDCPDNKIIEIRKAVRQVLEENCSAEEIKRWHWSATRPADQDPVGLFLTVKNYERYSTGHRRRIADQLLTALRSVSTLPIYITIEAFDTTNIAVVVDSRE